MPQASEELHREWGTNGGVGEEKAMNYLQEKGYKLSPGWLWILPTPDHKPTEKEIGAMQFLIDEWDFGGWVRDEEESKVYGIKGTVISSSTSDNSW